MESKKLYFWFCKVYYATLASFALLIAGLSESLSFVFEPAVYCYIFGFLSYLLILTILVRRMRKSVITWIGLTAFAELLGLVISYAKMKSLASEQNWI